MPRAPRSRRPAAQPAEVDLIVVGTTLPTSFSQRGVLLQARLGSSGAPAFGLEAACSGFMYALSMADKFVRSGEASARWWWAPNALDASSTRSDRGTAILFGDGAGRGGARAPQEPGIISTHLHADGHYRIFSAAPAAPGGVIRSSGRGDDITMVGAEVFKIAVSKLGARGGRGTAANGLDQAMDWLVPHQANIRIIQATARKLGLPMERAS